ncbi:hypothetical protein ACPPVQ_10825 [Diaminobutyricibacter sp. McL0618]|uniref:hypothetical protein n=1 Tax=Leifsonia sp. McL0618 TaxID=3415677 RepID=UPI003CEB4779
MAGSRMLRRWVIIAGSGAALLAALAIVVSSTVSTAPPASSMSPNPSFIDRMDSTNPPAWANGLTFTHATADLSREEAASFTSMPWRFVALEGDVLRMVFAAGDGACVLHRGFSITSTKTLVEVRVLSVTDTSQTARPSRLELGAADVTLTEPLDGRALVHSPTDPQWPESMLAD